MNAVDICTPEQMLVPSPDAPAGYPVDAILCAVDRANAVLTLLSGQFFSDDNDRYCDEIIGGVIWSARGELGLIKTLIGHGLRSELDSKKAQGVAK
jgi:hypothetical protein